MSSGVYRYGSINSVSPEDVLYYKDGKTSTISLIDQENGGSKTIRTNGKPDAQIATSDRPAALDELTMVMAAALPLSLSLKPDTRTVANIGLGSGLTSHTLMIADSITLLDTIEIESATVEAARGFGSQVALAFSDPRSVIHIDDAKSFFSSQQKKYDVIISEPSNPWMNGVASLFTFEFYKQVENYLVANGIFVQWVHIYENDEKNLASVMKAIGLAFENYQVYNTNDVDILIVASNKNDMKTLDPWLFNDKKMAAALNRVSLAGVDDIKLRYLGNKEILSPLIFAINSPMNSDYYPYVAYHAPKTRYLRTHVQGFSDLKEGGGIPVLDWLSENPNNDNDNDINSQKAKTVLFKMYAVANNVISGNEAELHSERLRLASGIVNGEFDDGFPVRAGIDAVFNIAKAINPYLSKSELDNYWKKLIIKFGADTNYKMTHWMHLHHEISQRNAQNSLLYAEKLWAEKQYVNLAQGEYLITAILTARIVLKQYSKAVEFAGEAELLDNLERLPILLRMLTSLAIYKKKNALAGSG